MFIKFFPYAVNLGFIYNNLTVFFMDTGIIKCFAPYQADDKPSDNFLKFFRIYFFKIIIYSLPIWEFCKFLSTKEHLPRLLTLAS